MTDRFPASHAEHDPLLIAALAAGDLAPARREDALVLAAACADCALLEADLRAIAAATAALPAPVRRRDFSLSTDDAARLKWRGWRGLARVLAGPRSAALKPLATGLTTLGIAGLLLAALPAIQLGGSAAGPTGPQAAAASDAVEAESDTNYLAPEGTKVPVRQVAGAPESAAPGASVPLLRPVVSPLGVDEDAADAAPGVGGSGSPAQPESTAPPVGPAASPLAVLSGTFLAVGLFLFGIRWAARRLSGG